MNLPEKITVDNHEYKVADLSQELQGLLVEHCTAEIQYRMYGKMLDFISTEIAHGVNDFSSMNTASILPLHGKS